MTGAIRIARWLAAAALVTTAANAAEIRVLSAAAAKGPLTEIAAKFGRETGHRVVFEFTTAGQVESKLAAGARADIVVNTRARLAARAVNRSGVVRDLGMVRIGVAARAGSTKPDITTVEGFRAALLAAQSVAYTDPAAGGTAGTHFAGVLDRLGITDAMAAKRRLAADGLDVMRKVGSGEAELGITQVSEILLVDRATFVGPMPESLQSPTIYSAFVPESASPAARAFADALTSDAGRARFDAAGFE
jgi:molybdate transport system substrate-binding protein